MSSFRVKPLSGRRLAIEEQQNVRRMHNDRDRNMTFTRQKKQRNVKYDCHRNVSSFECEDEVIVAQPMNNSYTPTIKDVAPTRRRLDFPRQQTEAAEQRPPFRVTRFNWQDYQLSNLSSVKPRTVREAAVMRVVAKTLATNKPRHSDNDRIRTPSTPVILMTPSSKRPIATSTPFVYSRA